MKYQPTETWEEALELCGDVVRPNAKDGQHPRIKTLARTYRVNEAAQRLNLKRGTIEEALILELLFSIVDPEGRVRIPAYHVEEVLQQPEQYERLAGLEIVSVKDIAYIVNMATKTIQRKLRRIGADDRRPEWAEIRGLWGLPETYSEYRQLMAERLEQEAVEKAKEEERLQRKKEEQAKQRKELQKKLVAVFPEWTHEDRNTQKIILHIGPPNSGKTYHALQALKQAKQGWYLAPLRLLAYEIFDRLNRDGVRCNLLTGEEYIPVEGATITAATIEMFNSNSSGDCIVIDEAQMLADSERGWAWTRAMIEARSPEIHMIAPATTQSLIEQMAKAAQLDIVVQKHERLTPIQVADRHWSLAKLPPHTILIAFSRRKVLELKHELEQRGRTVSVVYGSLPPEVRRRQSDRFANGETEICVATDAVGMGLNLPADNVVFYEIEKFDGRTSRRLKPEEVQQIGGRAGRFGLSEGGQVGAVQRYQLRFIRKMYYTTPPQLTHARIAPTLQDLEIIPGTLSHKLREWAKLRSIPDELRGLLRISNLEERISLAEMLSDDDVNKIGLAAAVKLINAPTRQTTRSYWYSCARAIINMKPMPTPILPPEEIDTNYDLDAFELSVSSADVYLWLGHRDEFFESATQLDYVHELRREWSVRIDEALVKQIRNIKRCSQCGKELPANYRYGICESCYAGRYLYDEF